MPYSTAKPSFCLYIFLIFSNISAAFVLLFRQNSAVQNICSEVQVTCKKQPRNIRQHQNTRNFIKFEKPACHYNHGDEQHHKQNERRKTKIKREKQRRPEHIQNELNEVNAERTLRLPADIRIVSAPNFFPLRSCLPIIYILAADIPIKTNKIVHTTGKSHDGGASGGCLSAPYSFMADIAKTEDIPPATSAATIETMYTNVLPIFSIS